MRDLVGEGPWLEFDRATFLANYNHRPFRVRHRLHEHPLFQWPELVKLALRMPPDNVLHRRGSIPIDADFDHAHKHHPTEFSIETTLERMVEVGGYVMVNNPELDPQFKLVVEEVLAEINQLSETVDPGRNWYAAYVFLSADGAVTPYHMDREMNFLLQIDGAKKVELWDPTDPRVMSEEQRERLLTIWTAERPQWTEAHKELSETFLLQQGDGLHHPFIAPHVVRTEPGLSVSLAVTWRTTGSDCITDAYKFNHYLRKTGLSPSTPGRSPRRDALKAQAYRRTVKTMRALKRGRK